MALLTEHTTIRPEELSAWLGLASIEGLGPRGVQKLLAQGLTAEALWQATPQQLAEWQLPLNLQFNWQNAQAKFNPEPLLAALERQQITLLSLSDSRYPRLLAEIYDPPIVLYVRGNLDALNARTLAWVGTRKASPYGQQVVNHLIHELAMPGLCIVSGLALGIDAMAHEAALAHKLATVAVLGSGIDVPTPQQNRPLAERILANGGAIVSEYPPGFTGDKYTFPRRNRIIAGLSHATVVVECPLKSGSLITARIARDENRQLFAVPGNIFSPNAQGPNDLIAQGATPLLSAEQLRQELNWLTAGPAIANPLAQNAAIIAAPAIVQKPGAQAPEATKQVTPTTALPKMPEQPEHAELLQQITYDPMSTELLLQKTQLPAAKLSEYLMMLELGGYIQSLPAAQVSRL
ncbi:MAG: DNA-processing protein DprA [Vampirovibrionales bacterium]|nr:DNA-processing protein DprA [Vampirovibrionales bacterium]